MIKRHMRFIKAMILSLILSSMLFGTNLQKTYLMTDDIWIRADRLCREAGVLGPTPVSPTTGAEIRMALSRLDRTSLSPRQKEELDKLMNELTVSDQLLVNTEYLGLDIDGYASLQAYGFNNTRNTYADEFFIPYRDRLPFLSGELHSYFGDLLYLDLQYIFKDSDTGFDVKNGKLVSGDYFYNFTNISMLASPTLDGRWYLMNFVSPDHVYSMNVYQPYKIGASLGNDYLNLFLGRTRHAMGNGITGNMVIGDNFSYQETLKLSAFTDVFSYYLTITHFDNVNSINDPDNPHYIPSDIPSSFSLEGPHQNRVMHRFDFNISNKIRFAINIGGLFVSSSAFDIRLLSPMMIVHNWCNNREGVVLANGDEGNNIMSFELEWAIVRGWSMSAQLVIDQMQVAGEGYSIVPNAFGFLINAKNTTALDNGSLDSWIEAVYTNPYLYLNYKENEDGTPNYFYDWIVGYGTRTRSQEINYAGHPFGPDTIAIAAGTGYTDLSGWNVSGSVLYKVHGTHGMKRNYWDQNDSNRVQDGESFNRFSPTGIPEHTLSFTVGGGYRLTSNIDLSGSAIASMKWNYHNQKDVFRTDVQFAIGVSWKIF